MELKVLVLGLLGQAFKPADLLLVGAVLLMTTALLAKLRKRRRAGANRPTTLEQIEQDRQLRGVRGDLEQLMVQVEQLAREFGAKLDAKTLALEKVIREAEEKIAQLRTASVEARSMPSPTSGPRLEGVSALQECGSDPVARSVYALADQGLSAGEIAQRLDEHIGKVELILALRAAG